MDYLPPPSNVSYKSLAGYVYLLKVRNEDGLYKIGRTREPENRMKTFKLKLPFQVDLLALIQTDNMYDLEKMLHRAFASKRTDGEFFYLTVEDVQSICDLQGNVTPERLQALTEESSDRRKSKRPVHNRIKQLVKENLELNELVEDLKSEFTIKLTNYYRMMYEFDEAIGFASQFSQAVFEVSKLRGMVEMLEEQYATLTEKYYALIRENARLEAKLK